MTFLLIMNLVIMKHHNVMQGVEFKNHPFLCISRLILQLSKVHHYISVISSSNFISAFFSLCNETVDSSAQLVL